MATTADLGRLNPEVSTCGLAVVSRHLGSSEQASESAITLEGSLWLRQDRLSEIPVAPLLVVCGTSCASQSITAHHSEHHLWEHATAVLRIGLAHSLYVLV
jgi:hypothetical protein